MLDHATGGTTVQAPNFDTSQGVPPGIGIPYSELGSLESNVYYVVVFFEGLEGCPRGAKINAFNAYSWGLDVVGPMGGFSTAWRSSAGGCIQQFSVDSNKAGGGWFWGALSNTSTSRAIADANSIPAFAVCDDFESCDNIKPKMPCVTDCNSSVLFLPGLEASRLYRPDFSNGTEDQLWEPVFPSDVEDLFMDDSGQSVRSDIYTRDVVDEIHTGGNIYKSFLTDLNVWKSSGTIADYSAVPYDWRLAMSDLIASGNYIDGRIYYTGDLNGTSTPYLLQELRRLAEGSKNGKVTIVAHSNGGLLAKALIKRLEDTDDPLLEKIENLILVAVPQTGTPEAVGALLHGFKQAHWPVISAELARNFAKNLPGLYPLLPSAAYWNGGGSNVAASVVSFEDGTDFAPMESAMALFGGDIENKEELDDFLLGSEGREDPPSDQTKVPALGSASLVDYANSLHASLDSWIPPQHMTVHQIAGWGENTLATIKYTSRKCPNPQGINCIDGKDWKYKPELVIDGDGTVVTPSALAMSTSSPNVKRWWINILSFNEENFINREHKNILEVPQLREFIRNINTSSSSNLPSFITEFQPPSNRTNRLSFFLHSPLDLTARDKDGNVISSSTNSIRGARYKRFGEVQYISVPAESNPTLILDGYASGLFDLDIEEERGGIKIATTTFASIPTATTTVVTMNFGQGDLESAGPLEIDRDGNGSVDILLEPKVGAEITIDQELPTVAILAPLPGDFERSKQIIVTATSTDNFGIAATSVSFGDRQISNGTMIDLFFERLGTATIRATAIDLYGNEASTSLEVRIIATASSTISDINRAYDLGWIYKKQMRDELVRKVEKIIKIEKKIVEIEEKVGGKRVRKKVEKLESKIDKIVARALIQELKAYRKEKMNEQAYNVIKEDLGWIINN